MRHHNLENHVGDIDTFHLKCCHRCTCVCARAPGARRDSLLCTTEIARKREHRKSFGFQTFAKSFGPKTWATSNMLVRSVKQVSFPNTMLANQVSLSSHVCCHQPGPKNPPITARSVTVPFCKYQGVTPLPARNHMSTGRSDTSQSEVAGRDATNQSRRCVLSIIVVSASQGLLRE